MKACVHKKEVAWGVSRTQAAPKERAAVGFGDSCTRRGESISAESLSGRFEVFGSIKGHQARWGGGQRKDKDGNSITASMPRALDWVTMVPVEGPTRRTGKNPLC